MRKGSISFTSPLLLLKLKLVLSPSLKSLSITINQEKEHTINLCVAEL
uniref:Uncharacterized protein n=1 Tax=Rhizophora mucronata TaxID=61149 RepID=A0A2P2QG81_RHIMU